MKPWWYFSCFSPTGSLSSPSVSLWGIWKWKRQNCRTKHSNKRFHLCFCLLPLPHKWRYLIKKADRHILHQGLGPFLQTAGEMLGTVAWPRVRKEALLVYSTQLGLHVLAPRDETGRKAPVISPPLHWVILSRRGRPYSLLKPGPPREKARLLNSVHTLCNCAVYLNNKEYILLLVWKSYITHQQFILDGKLKWKWHTCISLGPSTLMNLSNLLRTSCILGWPLVAADPSWPSIKRFSSFAKASKYLYTDIATAPVGI